MTLGEKLYQRRTELGLSQSEVADAQITRNMLSRLEHDQASPSVRTLAHLANKLNVSMSWLMEDGPMCVDAPWTEQARNLFHQGEYAAVLQLDTDQPLSEEGKLLLVRSAHRYAAICLREGNIAQARASLERIAEVRGDYLTEHDDLQTKCLLAECAMADGENRSAQMAAYFACDCLDRDLQDRFMMKAEFDLLNGDLTEAAAKMEQIAELDSARALYLRGRLMLDSDQKEQGAVLLEQALWQDETLGFRKAEIYRLLEVYYREQDDYKLAYHYASMRMAFLDK